MGECTPYPLQAFINYYGDDTVVPPVPSVVRGVVQPIVSCVVPRKDYDLPLNPEAFWVSWGYEFTNLDGSLPAEAIFDEVHHPCNCETFPCDCSAYLDTGLGGPLVNWFLETPMSPVCTPSCTSTASRRRSSPGAGTTCSSPP